MADKDKLGGEGSLEERFDRLTDDEGKPINDKEFREGEKKEKSQKISSREKRFRRRVERAKKKKEALNNINEYWYKDPNIAVKVSDGKYEELLERLNENRAQLELLKRYYCRSIRRQHDIITEAYMQEIKRHVLAIEGIKDIMTSKAERFRIYYTDREHPAEACERMVLDCFVASSIYGPNAPQTNLLRYYKKARLSTTVWGRLLIRIYYGFAGRLISKVLQRSVYLQQITRQLLDRFIDRLSRIL
ncbi:MAG: hypothetical protein KTR29_05870 [Rhodothermaceae bacterium]|nr:hypothetical protein [Rhodothermaceae bacterium]